MVNKMSLPGFNAEASLYKAKVEYKSYHAYNYQKSESISPAYMNFECLECLIRCYIICSPPRLCIISCPQMCSRQCSGSWL
jgi:hypothetical protein